MKDGRECLLKKGQMAPRNKDVDLALGGECTLFYVIKTPSEKYEIHGEVDIGASVHPIRPSRHARLSPLLPTENPDLGQQSD